jgi:hypothetical protein
MIAMPDTEDGTGRRHRVVVIGSGFGGLTGAKECAGRCHDDRQDPAPSVPAAALPSRHGHTVRGRDRSCHQEDPSLKQGPGAAAEDGRRDPARPTVVGVDRDGLTVKDSDGTTRRIESACKVWSAGVSASPLGNQIAEQAGSEVDRSGRVVVLPDLVVVGHPNVFVIGDMASVPGVPGMAQGAKNATRHQGRPEGRHARAAQTVPLLRQGLDGHGVALLRGRQGRPAGISRLRGVAGMAAAAYLVGSQAK